LENVLSSDGSDVKVGKTPSSEDSTVSFFPSVPKNVQEPTICASLLFYRLSSDEIVPPLGDGREAMSQGTSCLVVPCLDMIPDRGGERAVFAKVVCRLWGTEA
jgi:hypothetical protein